jgi:hypothetical protein
MEQAAHVHGPLLIAAHLIEASQLLVVQSDLDLVLPAAHRLLRSRFFADAPSQRSSGVRDRDLDWRVSWRMRLQKARETALASGSRCFRARIYDL